MTENLCQNDLKFLQTVEIHLQNIPAPCPYGLAAQATYRMAKFKVIPDKIMGILLAAGYRRYGDTIYTMDCKDCKCCIPIKLNPFEFTPNRNQRRTLKQNVAITTKKTPLSPNQNKLTLLQSFFNSRFPDRGNRAEDYYSEFFLNSSPFSGEVHYYSGERLLGVSIIDIGTRWLNAVYFFFAPEASNRSMGTFNIINLINLCREKNIDNLYLGYWLKESNAMNYKASFRPHYILTERNWLKVFK